MMTLLAFVFLAASLAVVRTADKPPAECSCEGPSCTNEKTVKCTKEDEDTCITVVNQHKLGTDNLFNGTFKGCAKTSNSLDGQFSFAFGQDVRLDIASKPCPTIDCDASLKIPWIQNMLNGKECPQCYASGHSNCEANGTVFCRGDLLNCTTVTGVVIEGNNRIPFAGKGCATPSVCGLAERTAPAMVPSGLFTIQLDKVTCNGALAARRTLGGYNLGSQVVSFFPCLLGILTVKTFSA